MSSPAPDPPREVNGFELSALSAYAGPAGSLVGVSFWPRVAARVIDMIIHIIVSFCAGLIFSILVVIAAEGHPSQMVLLKLQQKTVAIYVLATLGLIAYHAICEGLHGSTLGKLILSMVVLQEDGSPCGMRPAVIRSFAYVVDALFFGVVGYFAMQGSVREQRYGDEWAHTVVCHRAAVSPEVLRSGSRFAGAFLLAVMVDAALGMTALLLNLVTY